MGIYIIGLVLCLVLLTGLLIIIINSKSKKQVNKAFAFLIACSHICCVGQLLSIFLSEKFNIPPIYFDYIVYIGTCFLPVGIFFTSLTFVNTKVKFKKEYILLFVIPIISLIMLWTNDLHHLFYIEYSKYIHKTIFGPYFTIHTTYTYSLFAIGIIYLLRYSIKNAGFFSKQSILIIIGTLIPIVVNLFGTLNLIPMTIYVTPICFVATTIIFALAIFKFNFLSVTPIAMQRVVDRMSDSFIVVNDEGIITDFNDTLLKTFSLNKEKIRNEDFVKFVDFIKNDELNKNLINKVLEKSKKTTETINVKKEIQLKEKYFNIEASGIYSKGIFLGTLILLKDVTQHVLDMETIEKNQDLLMERERLASLGQLVGGIAHNLKTPIMSISGAAEGLSDLIKEYELSVEDPDVTVQDHKEIANEMNEWILKIRNYTEYMSDIITAVKGQVVAMSDEQVVLFTIEELVKRVDILMKHELKNALITLNTNILIDKNASIKGNLNSLVQVVNNMISNSIQAYNGAVNKDINLIVSKKDNIFDIAVQDFGGGLPEKVKDKLFKEMITTKGKNGTGLGLFMSYSTIRAHFNGNITVESEAGKGTTFHILIPQED